VNLNECARIGARLGPEEGVEVVARAQHAMVHRQQLLALGLGRTAIQYRVSHRELTLVHRGVYLVGPVAPSLGDEMAAVLACGDQAWISHTSAARLHNLLPHPAKPHPIQLVVTGSDVRRKGLRVRRVDHLDPDEITVVDGIPVTTAKRTILDMAAREPAILERVLSEAIATGQTNRDRLLELCERRRGARGTGRLRALLDDPALTTRSNHERRLRRLLRKAGLPVPQTNARVGRWEVDFLWPEHRLIVEVDALATHSSPFHFERDRRKDAELTLLGYTVIRVTARQLEEEPEQVVARIAAFLATSAQLVPVRGVK